MKSAFLLSLMVGIVFAISATAASAAAGWRRASGCCCCCCIPQEVPRPVEQACEAATPARVEQPAAADPPVVAAPPAIATEPASSVAENTPAVAVTEQDDYWYDGQSHQYHKYDFGGRSGDEEAAETVLSQSDDELDRGLGTGEAPSFRMAQSAEVEVVPGEDSPEPPVVEKTPEVEMKAASTQDSDAAEDDAAMRQSEAANGASPPRTDDAPAARHDDLADLFDEVFGGTPRATKPEAAAAPLVPATESVDGTNTPSPEPAAEMPANLSEAPAERFDVTEPSVEAALLTTAENTERDRQALLPWGLILEQLGTALQDLRQHLSAMAAETVAKVPAVKRDTRIE